MDLRNAQIDTVALGYEDHGLLTCILTLKYGKNLVQGFGGHILMSNDNKGGDFGMLYIKSILDTVGVKRWEDLRGKYVRVQAEKDKVQAIGNILEEKWFNPTELAEEWKKKNLKKAQKKNNEQSSAI